MSALNAKKAHFQEVELLGVPGLFTALRVDRSTIPPGMYAYDMQTSKEDWSQPCLLAQDITAEHFGTILTASPIELPANGYRDLKPGDFSESGGLTGMTAAEFECKYLSPKYQPPQRHYRAPALTR